MKELPKKYDHKESEKKWQDLWFSSDVYSWDESQPRDNTFVIDTPPPTVSGVLHMGHIFSYTQADFVARYQRMSGKTVFYPMGFDDNGLPTERLVEKVKKVKAAKLGREKFIEECEEVAEGARDEFRRLFKSVALSVDWNQEYHTISEESRKISQLSFLDLFHKDKVYRKLQPMLWDPVDQTAIAQAEIEEKQEKSHANYINFGLITEEQAKNPSSVKWESLEKVEIMTTRPELIGACVALICHPDDAHKYVGKKAVTPLFNVVVDIIADDKVDKEKGTGLVMCCTFGDETDIAWWREYDLPTRVILNKYGKIDNSMLLPKMPKDKYEVLGSFLGEKYLDIFRAHDIFNQIVNKKARPSTGNIGGSAREIMVELLKQEPDAFIKQEKITHAEPCAERSGAPLEILPTQQWFVKILDQKEELKAKAEECNWYPQYMKIRIDQWIDGLSWDWCISRQRYFGVPFPVWYVEPTKNGFVNEYIVVAEPKQLPINPLNFKTIPEGFEIVNTYISDEDIKKSIQTLGFFTVITTKEITCFAKNGVETTLDSGMECRMYPEKDVMDTWATSSVSPQLSSKGINRYHASIACNDTLTPPPLGGRGVGEGVPSNLSESSVKSLKKASELITKITPPPTPPASRGGETENPASGGGVPEAITNNNDGIDNPYLLNPTRHSKLFPADLRPQAHEIIRTWAFYTIVKAHLHEDVIPWKNLMISGWCLAADKTKMSKSKGNVVTPIDLIEEKGTDAVRYWASTSNLGTDTAFSEDVLKIGKKLVNKIWNATKFGAIQLENLKTQPTTAKNDIENGVIVNELDKWIISRLGKAITKATTEFEKYEYCRARVVIEDFFWNDFCDNYLEMVKTRAYNEDSSNNAGQQSAVTTIYHVLEAVLKLFAPFVPHITEELYSHIFDDKYAEIGSIHASGTWSDAALYPIDEEAESTGISAKEILDVVRKVKAEQNVSIKWPIERLLISAGSENGGKSDVDANISDIASVTNSKSVKWSEKLDDSIETEDSRFAIQVVLAAESDTA